MPSRSFMFLLTALSACAAFAACDASPPASGGTASTSAPSAATQPLPPPRASSAVTTMASAPASAPPAASSAPAAVASGDASPADQTCGKKPLPDCPLQAWMKKNVSGPSLAQDFPKVATGFADIAKLAPPGYANWVSISKDGEKAAKDGRADAVKAACNGCHRQYKDKYKAELRTRPI